jgi:hypothetical protein
LKKYFLLISLSLSLLATAEVREHDIKNADASFIGFLVDLKTAAQIKNPYPIIRSISKSFELERDFGGMYSESKNSVVNFLIVYPIDGFEVKDEYKSKTWSELEKILSSRIYVKRSNSDHCVPKEKYHNDITLDELLCFHKNTEGHWEISSYVFAGD